MRERPDQSERRVAETSAGIFNNADDGPGANVRSDEPSFRLASAGDGGGAAGELALGNWVIQPRRIGGRVYQGDCSILQVRNATYQQQSTTFGRTTGVFGLSGDGHGFVTGGGGFVDTSHRGVISTVVEDEYGRHTTVELPAEASVLPDSVIRLDRINGHVIAVTNMSGRQGALLLLAPSAFVAGIGFTRIHGVLMLATVLMAGQILSPHPIGGLSLTLACAALPVLRWRRIRNLQQQRHALKDYMVEVMS